jgi:predicted MFS family arabinose efflux permease
MVPHIFLISEWFSSNRASAIGVVYAGSGVGIMLLAPLSAWLISAYGWERAFEIYAVPWCWFCCCRSCCFPINPDLIGHSGAHGGQKKGEQNQWTAETSLAELTSFGCCSSPASARHPVLQ